MKHFLRLLIISLIIPVASTGWAVDPSARLAKSMISKCGDISKKRVVVLSFPYANGKVSSGSTIVAERLTTDLVLLKRCRVIERRLIRKMFEEKHLSETGLIDATSVRDVGSLTGSDIVVTGTLIDLDNGFTEVNARMIDTENGTILGVGKATVQRVWRDSPMNPKPMRTERPGNDTPKTEPALSDDSREPTREASVSVKDELRLSNENLPADSVWMAPEKSHRQDADYEGYDQPVDSPSVPYPNPPMMSQTNSYPATLSQKRVQRFQSEMQRHMTQDRRPPRSK